MKIRSFVLFIILFSSLSGVTQTVVFKELMTEGEIYLKRGSFIDAFEIFTIAKEKAIDENQIDDANDKITQARDSIIKQQEKLKIQNERLQVLIETINREKETKKKLIDQISSNDDDIYSLTMKKDKNGIKCGYINKDGEVMIPLIYNDASTFDEDMGIAFATKEEGGDYYLIDTTHGVKGEKYTEYVLITDTGSISKALKETSLKYAFAFISSGLKNIPKDVFKYSELKYLMLNDNSIKELPEDFCHLTELKVLDLDNNDIKKIPLSITSLKTLKVLYLSGNKLDSFPSEFRQLTNLSVLTLYNNDLTTLPPVICDLTNLTLLDLGQNILTSLPPEIGKLKNLATFSLCGNNLQILPPGIENLTKLTKLNLCSNKLQGFPLQLVKLTNLKALDLSNNKLKSLPPSIGDLKNLVTLNLSNNNLKSLPPEIGKLTELENLDLSSGSMASKEFNVLTSLPTEIENLKNLKKLDISNNKINSDTLEKIKKLLPPDCIIIIDTIRSSQPSIDPVDSILLKANDLHDAHMDKEACIFIKNKISSADYRLYFALSYYCLFTKEYKKSIEYAKKTLELEPEAQSVETNLALGYLLNNQWPEAKAIYMKWKDKSFPDDKNESCNDLFISDILALENAGITHKNFKEVKKIFN